MHASRVLIRAFNVCVHRTSKHKKRQANCSTSARQKGYLENVIDAFRLNLPSLENFDLGKLRILRSLEIRLRPGDSYVASYPQHKHA